MNEFLKAADDARRLLSGFKSVAQVADAFEQAGRVVQAKTEAEAKLAFLLTQIETAKVEAEGLAAKHAADESAAQLRTAELVAAAQAKALTIVADAQTAAANTELAAEQIKAQASALLAQAQTEVLAAVAKREQLEQDCEALEKRLAKAQAQIAKLLG